MAKRKKHTSPQTRIKQKEAAKRRHRAPANSAHAGEFVSENHSHLAKIMHQATKSSSYQPRAVRTTYSEGENQGEDPGFRAAKEKGQQKARTKANQTTLLGNGTSLSDNAGRTYNQRKGLEDPNTMYHRVYGQQYEKIKDEMRGNMPDEEVQEHAHEITVDLMAANGLPTPDRKTARKLVAEDPDSPDLMESSIETTREQHERIRARGYQAPPADFRVPARPSKSSKRIDERIGLLPQDEQDALKAAYANPDSPLYRAKGSRDTTARAYQRLQTYLDVREQNPDYDPNQIIQAFNQDNRGTWTRASSSRGKSQQQKDIQQRARTGKSEPAYGLKDKHASGIPKHEDVGFGIEVPGVDSISELSKRFPTMSESELIQYQEGQRQTVYEYSLSRNEKWSHELRADRALGGRDLTRSQQSEQGMDKVVVFTTNVGGPTVSVSSQGLLGQYVIKQRKKMVVDDRLASRSSVKGEFPRAVRDQHLIEVSAGGLLGAQGRYGVFQNTGWRKGTKKSKGFGKQTPVGSQVLRDTNGQPVYDNNGNLRYTEGYTAPFSVSTNTVGLRIFLG